MTTTSSSTYQSIEKLLQFQNSFLNLVHSEVLCYEEGDKRKQALLKFQVLEISDKNQIFNDIITKLKKELIEQKQQCDSVLKSYFLKLLQLDYLPLLHVNRYELTKLSIFGFDIYIDPLEAILQILNRLQRVLYILEDSLKDSQMSQTVKMMVVQKKTLSEILLTGWKAYYCFLHLHKLTLNIYMLKEYINIAITSLPKKDKEIIFTGVYNIYKRLIPMLTQHHLTTQLQELSDLNNMMYNFHGSFDYFLFYTYLQPTKEYITVFNRVGEIQKKCSHTNILTPLLFGVMNNYKAFVKFIENVQSMEYVHLLRVLLSGLITNFKLRILEYNEVLQLIGLTINKLCLLNKMKMKIITAQLSKQWQQAKQFFISAFKSGYNPGEIQTWTLCESKLIQPTIIAFLIKGLLLMTNSRNDQFLKGLQKAQLQEVLENQLKQLTDGGQTLNGLMNNWKLLTIATESQGKKQTQAQQNDAHDTHDQKESNTQQLASINKRQSKCLNIVRIINLMSFLQLNSQRLVYSMVSALNTIGPIRSHLVKNSLSQSIETLNEIIAAINRKQSLSNLKDILPQFHMTYPPKRTFEDIVPVYLHSFITREAINSLLDLLTFTQQSQRIVHMKQVLTAIVHKYFTKPQQQEQNVNTTQYETYKSFDKQYNIPISISVIDPEPNTVYSNIVKILTSSAVNTQTQINKRKITYQILLNLMKHSPHHIIAVMNLPAMQKQKIGSFLDWLINSQTQESKQFIIFSLRLLNQFADKTQPIFQFKLYLHQCYHFNVLDGILASLVGGIEKEDWHQNVQNIHIALDLVDLFVEIYEQFVSISRAKDTNSMIPNILCSVWTNLLDLLAYLLKNSQYQTQTTIKSCKLYWKIIQIIKGDNLNLWYHKLTINRIFSTLTNENLLLNQTFKGITLISSVKNYLISKETNSQIQQNIINEKPQRYAFSDIKGFFEENYLAISSVDKDKSKNKNSNNQLSQFLSLIKESKAEKKPINAQIHIANEKEMPPCLSEQNMHKIYEEYCKGKAQDEQKQENKSLEFCLLLLTLNPVNHQYIWRIIIKSERKIFLEQMSFTRQTVNEVLQVVRHFQNHYQQNQEENKKSLQGEIEEKLHSMLGLDLLQYSINELELLASAYYFDQSKLETFVKHKEVLWFLIICNNSGWRQFNEVFSTHLKNCCFLSNLLQYKEYLSITYQMNKDYEQKVEEFSQLIDQYLFYVQKKLDSIDLLKVSDSEKENTIRKSTLLINIKVLLLKCDVEKILEKVKILLKELHDNSLEDDKFRKLLVSLHNLNKLCNKLLGGNIKLPSFTHHNLYTTSQSDEKQFFLGTWIEQCERGFENNNEVFQNKKSLYVPNMENFVQKDRIQDFINENKDEVISMRKTLDTKIERGICHAEYTKLRENLKDYLQPETLAIELKHENCNQIKNNLLSKFYDLGYLYFIQNSKQNNEKSKPSKTTELNLSAILQNLTKREKISLQVIKEVDASAYHQLKVFIMTNKLSLVNKQHQQHQVEGDQTKQNIPQTVAQKEFQKITFVWNGKELLPKGQQTIVNDGNKDLYLELIADEILGNDFLKLNNSFALGFINAQIIDKNI